MATNKRLVYLAGKISKNDWRHKIFQDLRDSEGPQSIKPIDGLSYGGPFFIGCDHGCFHGDNKHGRGIEESGCGSGTDNANGKYVEHTSTPKDVINKCINWLISSDILFVWLDSPDAYGTIAEIGYAFASKKPIFVGISDKLKNSKDMWFACHMADIVFKADSAKDAWDIFSKVYDIESNSLDKRKLPSKEITEKQKKFLKRLLKKSDIKLKVEIDDLNVLQARDLINHLANDTPLPPDFTSLIE